MSSVKSAAILLVVIMSAGVMGAAPTARAFVQAATTPGHLNDDKLRQMLDGMGLEPKPLSKGFLIAIKRESWTINLQLVISPDQAKIGMNANLGVIENPDAVTAAQWKALLAANTDIDPSSFYFDSKQKKLYMHRVLDNREVTPAYLRTQIDNFIGNMKSTEALWSFTK